MWVFLSEKWMNSFSDLQNNKTKLCNPISSIKIFLEKGKEVLW